MRSKLIGKTVPVRSQAASTTSLWATTHALTRSSSPW
jgi:hypothetical protein